MIPACDEVEAAGRGVVVAVVACCSCCTLITFLISLVQNKMYCPITKHISIIIFAIDDLDKCCCRFRRRRNLPVLLAVLLSDSNDEDGLMLGGSVIVLEFIKGNGRIPTTGLSPLS